MPKQHYSRKANAWICDDCDRNTDSCRCGVYCQNCGHTGNASDFAPTDGRPETLTCPECESVDVFYAN